MKSMDEAYRRDYDFKAKCEEAQRALQVLLDHDNYLAPRTAVTLAEARDALKEIAAATVRRWD